MSFIQLNKRQTELYYKWIKYLEEKNNEFNTYEQRTIAFLNAMEDKEPKY